MNQNFTLPAFAEPITGLPDTPTCAADELKRRFQAPADEVRKRTTLWPKRIKRWMKRSKVLSPKPFAGAIHESMFDDELSQKLNGKAEQTHDPCRNHRANQWGYRTAKQPSAEM